MTYKINGTELLLQPTTGRWLPREMLGVNGFGHPIYPAVREFEITWQLKGPSEANQLQNFFNSVGSTGTSVVELPQYAAATYVFYAYSGCVLHEPNYGEFFTQNILNVSLMISNIRV